MVLLCNLAFQMHDTVHKIRAGKDQNSWILLNFEKLKINKTLIWIRTSSGYCVWKMHVFANFISYLANSCRKA